MIDTRRPWIVLALICAASACSPTIKLLETPRFTGESTQHPPLVALRSMSGIEVRDLTTKAVVFRQSTLFNDLLGVDAMNWSPDGSMLAYMDTWSLWIYQVGQAQPMQILKGDVHGDDTNIAWSPSGRLFVFERSVWIGDGANRQLHVVDLSSGTARPITRGPSATQPDWSALDEIAYVQDSRLYVIRPDGGARREVAVQGSPYYPRWSPDGRRLALIERQSEAEKLVLLEPSTGKRVEAASADKVYPASWCPDGSKLLAAIWDKDEAWYYVFDADGAKKKRVARAPKLGRLMTIPIGGGRVARTAWISVPPTYSVWAADGGKILIRRPDERDRHSGIYWFDLTSGVSERVNRVTQLYELAPASQ